MQTGSITTRFGRWSGILSAAAALIFWAVSAVKNQLNPDLITGDAWIRTLVMLLVAAAGLLAALRQEPHMMLLVFLLSFFPVGLYLLGVPSLYRLIGVADLVFFLSGLLLFKKTNHPLLEIFGRGKS